MADADEPKHILIEVANAALFHELRSALAAGEFDTVDSTGTAIKWPMADLTNERKTVVARAFLKPSKQSLPMPHDRLAVWEARVADHVGRLGDVTADCLDILTHVWIKQAHHPLDLATVTTADFLKLRGIKAQKGSGGRRSGYARALKDEIARQIHILNNLWITCFDLPAMNWEGRREQWTGEVKAIVVHSLAGPVAEDGDFDVEVWRLAPGEPLAHWLLGPGRQTALMSQRALNYNPLSHWPEKRLCRYFAYQTRLRQRFGNYCGPFKVRTLLRAIRMPIDDYKPSKTRSRLEVTLDKLREDGIITDWRYVQDDVDERLVHERHWALKWQEWRIEIAPPEDVIDRYSQIRLPSKEAEGQLLAADQQLDPVVVEFKMERRRRGLSLQAASEQLGVHWNYLAMNERGARPLSAQLRQKMTSWLQDRPEDRQ